MKVKPMADILENHDPMIEITDENADEQIKPSDHDMNYATNAHVIKPNTNSSSNTDRNMPLRDAQLLDR